MVVTQKFILACAKELAKILKIEEVDDDVLNHLAEWPWNKRPDVQQLWPDKNAFVTYLVFHAKRLAFGKGRVRPQL